MKWYFGLFGEVIRPRTDSLDQNKNIKFIIYKFNSLCCNAIKMLT